MSKAHEITSITVEDFGVDKAACSTFEQMYHNSMKMFCGSLQSRIVHISEGPKHTHPSQKTVINDGN